MDILLYQGISRAGEDSAQSRVDVPYRIDQAFFVPVTNDDRSLPWLFVRRGEVMVDLVDSLGVSRARAIEEVVGGQNSSERAPEQKQWSQGVASFLVPPGNYTIQVEVIDLETKMSVLEKSRKVRAGGLEDQGIGLSTPTFVMEGAASRFPDTLTLQNFGGDILFGAPGSLFFEVNSAEAGGADTALVVSWSIVQVDGDGDESRPVARDTAARVMTFPRMSLRPARPGQGAQYHVASDPSSRVTGVLVPLPAESLPLRMFDLHLSVSRGPRQEQRKVTFRTFWPSMPFSLKDVDLALHSLRFIVTPDQLDSLERGSYEERREHLETFWKLRDKTPATAGNELMTEYYRRVDYAMRNFGTLRVPDGSRTDRGRIYILYGPPTSTDRTLDPASGFQEIWIYERLGKKFVFVDVSKSGNYQLSSTTGL
jgi:GWxTD domain-containing protein